MVDGAVGKVRREGSGRRWPIVAAVVAVLVALGVVVAQPWDEDAPSEETEVADLSAPGSHPLASPPIAGLEEPPASELVRQRTDAVAVWAGDRLVIWGGLAPTVENETNPPRRMLADGATLSLEDGRWTPMSAAPFTSGVHLPLGAWDGDEVIVVGVRCEAPIPPGSDGGPIICPQGPVAAAYDPATDTWRELEAPPLPVDSIGLERGRAAGADGTATFVFGWKGEAITWDRATEAWTAMGPAFGPDADPSIDVEHCVDQVDGTAVAAQVFQPGVDGRSPIRTLSPGATRWEDPGFDLDLPLTRSGFTCSDGVIVKVPSLYVERIDVLDRATGRVVPGYDQLEAVDFAGPWALGPWIFVPESREADDRPGDAPRSGRVRLAPDGPWSDFDGIDTAVPTAYDPLAVHVPGVGAIIGRLTAEPGGLVLWRAPEELLAE